MLLSDGVASVDGTLAMTRSSLVSRLAALQATFMAECGVSPARDPTLAAALAAHTRFVEALVLDETTAGRAAAAALLDALSAAVAAAAGGELDRVAAAHGVHVRGVHERATRALIAAHETVEGRVEARTALDRAIAAGREMQLRDAHAAALAGCRAEGAAATGAAHAAAERARVEATAAQRQLSAMQASMTELGRVIGGAVTEAEEGGAAALLGGGAGRRKPAGDPRALVEGIATRLKDIDALERGARVAGERAAAAEATCVSMDAQLRTLRADVSRAEAARNCAEARESALALEKNAMAAEMRKAKEAAATSAAAARKYQSDLETIMNQGGRHVRARGGGGRRRRRWPQMRVRAHLHCSTGR